MSAEDLLQEQPKPPNPYEQKQEERRARLERAAERAKGDAEQYFESAHNRIAGIPPGQPILVGHHSERRHRGDLKRHDTLMRKGIEAQKEAKEYAYRASAVGRGGISSDDPEAIPKLEEKLIGMKASRDRMKTLNALHRKNGTLSESDFATEGERLSVASYARFGGSKVPYPAYALQNLGARIRTTEKRIKELKRNAERKETAPEQIGQATITQDIAENRVLISFPERLSREDYKRVRSYGFVWARTKKAFVRKLNNAAIESARIVARQLAEKASEQSPHS